MAQPRWTLISALKSTIYHCNKHQYLFAERYYNNLRGLTSTKKKETDDQLTHAL